MTDFSIKFNSNTFIIIIGILLLLVYAFYVYNVTIPKLNPKLKFLLTALRAAAIISLFLLILEPLLTLIKKEYIRPFTYIFVDNSNSIAAKDSTSRNDEIKELSKNLISSNTLNTKVVFFGTNVSEIEKDSIDNISLSEPTTNFSKLFNFLKKEKEIVSSAVIISDGIVNDGQDPFYESEKSSFPIITVGIGDTNQYRDVKIREVLYNQYIYSKTPTEFDVIVSSNGYKNQKLQVTLYENDKKIDTQEIFLSESGINRIKFGVTPSVSGVTKYKASVSPIISEENKINNSKTFMVDVLDSKIKVMVIAGSPSSDLSAIIQSLHADKNIDAKKIVQISENKFWGENNFQLIDSADVLFLIDFPKNNSQRELIDKVFLSVKSNKPYFIQITPETDFQELNKYYDFLPITFGAINKELLLANPEINSTNVNSVLSPAIVKNKIWSSLAPILIPSAEINIKAGSNILIKSVARNFQIQIPLLVTRFIASQRSMVLIGRDIWRWNLATSESSPGFFSNLISEITKWLNVSKERKQFIIKTNKNLFASGEEIRFTAELYDQTFSAIDSASIEMQITNGDNKYNLILEKIRNGIYESVYLITQKGDYSFEGTAHFNGTSLKSNIGKFVVTDSDIEKSDTRMNQTLLKQIAEISGGKYYDINKYKNLIDELEIFHSRSSKELVTAKEYNLSSWILALLFIILLFSVEWFIRKFNNML